MTPKIIELKQAPVVLVELPDGIKHIQLTSLDSNPPIISIDAEIDKYRRLRLELPFGDDYLGILSDLTEDQFAECVDSWGSVWNDGSKVYENYKDSVPKKRTAKDSFYSLLESEKVYTEKPLEKVAKSVGHGTLDNFDQDYEEAQSRTIDAKRTVLLLKK